MVASPDTPASGEPIDCGTKGRKHGLGFLERFRDEYEGRVRVLVERVRFRGPHLRIERSLPDVFNNANDGENRFRTQAGVADPSADGILAREVPLSQRLIDDHD